jgi:hypothetical protein
MMSTKKGIVLALPFLAFAGVALAEPSYLVYPSSPAVFRFDTGRYELLTPDSPKFDPTYGVGNLMLWDRDLDRVPVEIYRAPYLTGFEPSPGGANEFVTVGNNFDIIIDGFGPTPRTIGGLCLRLWPQPTHAFVEMELNDEVVDGLTVDLPNLEVTTQVGFGYYANTSSYKFSWVGATELRIIAFSDKNADGSFDGIPAYSIVVRDAIVPVAESTWGRVKALYRR